jgi:hypothetical protein
MAKEKGGAKKQQWPVHLDELNPAADFLKGSELVLAADCTGFAFGAFHEKFLKGKALAITCPTTTDAAWRIARLASIFERSEPKLVTIALMDTPCCGGLLDDAKAAMKDAKKNIPMRVVKISTEGKIVEELEV